MAADISVGIGIQGEKEFKRALDECQNSLKQLDAELKANAAEFGENADAMRSSYERNELLKKSLKENVKINDALGDAIAFASDKYGEASKEATRYATMQAKARENIARLSKELEQSDRNMLELGRDSARVGRQLEEGIGEAAEDVGNKFDAMVNKLDADVADIGKTLDIAAGFTIGGQIISGVTQVIDGIDSIASETEDYRRRMSFLEQNALTAGLDPDKLKTIAMRVASITGEMDGAIEGVSNLAAAGLNIDEIATAADRLVSAAIMWPETLKFESMADGLQESIATKNAVGQYAELLERLELDIEKINKSLEETPDAQATQTAAMAWMTQHGLEESLAQYMENNEQMIKAAEAQLQYNDALAGFAEVLLPSKTAFTEFKTEFLRGTTELIDGGFQDWLNGINESLQGGMGLNEWMKNLLGEDLYNKLFTEGREEIKQPVAPGTYAGMVTEEEPEPDLTVKPGTYAGLVELGEEYGEATAQGYRETVEKELDVSDAVKEARKELSTWEGIDDGTIADRIIDSTELEEDGKTGGEAIISGIDAGVAEAAAAAEANMETTGKNLVTELANGAAEQSGGFLQTMQNIFNEAQRIFDRPIRPNIGGGWDNGYDTGSGTSGNAGGDVNVSLNVDGRSYAKATATYNSAAMGRDIDRNVTYVT